MRALHRGVVLSFLCVRGSLLAPKGNKMKTESRSGGLLGSSSQRLRRGMGRTECCVLARVDGGRCAGQRGDSGSSPHLAS